ncbi:MAG: flagellar filament capping protein FliD [Dehalococcoidia bacterium]
MVSSSAGVSSSSGRITFGGLASGIDTNSIITALMGIQQRPITAIQKRVSSVQTRIEAYGSLSSAISALMTAAAPLKDPATFSQRTASVLAQTADANKISASASAGAALQGFTFEAISKATATTVTSPAALGLPVSSAVPLDEAGFGTEIVAGTFSINGQAFTIDAATASTYESGAAVGTTVSQTAHLVDAGFDLVPTSGSIVVNGETISIDVDADSLNDVIARINASEAGVTASFDATTKMLLLTADETGPSAITIADAGGGTFLQSMNMLDGGGGNVGTITAGTDLISLDDVISQINAAGLGVTATIENDSLGHPNLLQLTSATTIQLGSGGDTSNFLSVTSLLQSPTGTTRTSVVGLGQVQPSANLEDARLATSLSGSSGSFKVNGVEVTWDATVDSLQNILTRINSAGAGVTATYDVFSDQMHLVSNDTGSTAIGLEDVSGNLLTATGLLGTTQATGSSASYKINGGPVRYSTSNVITDAVAGMSVTISDIPSAAVTINVNLGAQAVQTAVSNFVSTYNKTTTLIRDLTKYDAENGYNGLLFGDATVQRLEAQMRSTLTGYQSGMPGGLRSLSDVGLTFGAIGSAVGSTNDLVVDAAKLGAKLTADPDAVGKLLTAFTAGASLDAGGTGMIASISGTPTAATKAGRYSIITDVDGDVQATFQANDGSAPLITTGVFTAGGTNTSLIPGVTITAKGVITAGTDLVTITGVQQGFGKSIYEYLNSVGRSGGLLSTRSDGLQSQITDLNNQIDTMTARLTVKEQQLVSKFSAMEQAIQRIQSQGTQLTNIMAQLSNSKSSS